MGIGYMEFVVIAFVGLFCLVGMIFAVTVAFVVWTVGRRGRDDRRE